MTQAHLAVPTVKMVPCQIVHVIPNRIRIRIPRLAIDAEYAKRLHWLTASLDFVTDVRINAAASSLIVQHTIADSIELCDRLRAIIQRAVTFQIPQRVELPATDASKGSNNLGGVGWMLLATGSFAGMQAVIRLLAVSIHPLQIAFLSHLFGLIILTPWIANGNALKTNQLHWHGLRSIIDAGATLLLFVGLPLIPLAEANALLFTAPLFAMLGATLFLGEQMQPHSAVAIGLGLVGTLVILRPGLEIVGLGSLLILGGAIGLAGSMLLLKVLSQTDSSLTSNAYALLMITPLLLIPALGVWQMPTLVQILGIAAIAVLMLGGQMAVAQAFEEADLTAVLPVDFTQLIWSSALGYWLFAEVPDLWIWVGGLLIFAGSLYTAQAEAVKAPEAAIA